MMCHMIRDPLVQAAKARTALFQDCFVAWEIRFRGGLVGRTSIQRTLSSSPYDSIGDRGRLPPMLLMSQRLSAALLSRYRSLSRQAPCTSHEARPLSV